MFRPLAHPPTRRRAPRRGTAILITMFALITILMVLGLAFIMYAIKEKAVARAHADGVSASTRLAPDPTDTANRFFGALVYDELDDHDPSTSNGGSSLLNAMRGHSIARSMYGSRHDFSTTYWPGSTVPWAGVGTFHTDPADPTASPYGDRALQVNHTLMMIGTTPYLLDAEWTGSRTITAAGVPPFAGSTTGRNYIGKHAGYTYPDLKNLFLGQRDPATGEVLVPSFHRPWLFGPLDPTNGGATAANNNWTNAAGKHRILRPRPAEHPKFPRVPPNAPDPITGVVTYTGDVQNLPGHVGLQKNDSLWMHIGLPQITLEDGRIVQPMVAPLVLALDGVFDASIHGNRLGTGGIQSPSAGSGPWAIDPLPGMASEAERQALIVNRFATRSAQYDPFTTGQPLPNYSSVAFSGAATTFQLPSGGSILGLPSSGDPSFQSPPGTPLPFGGYQNDNATVKQHPAGYSPNDYGPGSDIFPNSPVAPYSDLKRLSLRYAFTPEWYKQSYLAKLSPPMQTFVGDALKYPYNPAPVATRSATNPGTYRLDPAHTRRLLHSPRNSSLERPMLTPNFVDRGGANALALPAGANKPTNVFATPAAYPSPQGLGPVTDFAAANRWVNAQAALGSVNVNRPLADYRLDTTMPLSATNVGNVALADADRQQLAKDIFVRLVAALGAAAVIDPNTGNITSFTAAPGSPQYDALRYLAQLAVNLVDYIDNDDVSTVFVWNPLAVGVVDLTDPVALGDRVVFGVEKPRLVINEGYSEIVNDPADPPGNGNQAPNGDAHVRFWLELLNPTTTPTAGTPLGDGSVPLSAYRIEIRRAHRQTILPANAADANATVQNDYLYANQSNTAGGFELSNGAPDAVFMFPAPPAGRPGSVGPNHNPTTTAANNAYSPPAGSLAANGFVLVGPPAAKRGDDFSPTDPQPNNGPWQSQNVVESVVPTPAPNSLGMGYTMKLPNNTNALASAEFKRHIVLLRRAANPYLPPAPATNPYVTTDVMDHVPAFDAVHTLGGVKGANRSPRAMVKANLNGYDPTNERFSIGKVQPYAGRSVSSGPDTNGYNTYTFPTSMVLKQTAVNAREPNHTFGRHNGNGGQPAGTTFAPGTPATLNDTIMTPFDWLIHMDRPLETLGDVFGARDCPPHRVTNDFVVASGAAPGVSYEASVPRWRHLENGLARGMEYLTVKSTDARIAHGGRVGGKVNANVMVDQRVAQGVFDAPAASPTGFDQAFVNTKVWNTWMNSRTPLQAKPDASGTASYQVPVPTSSVADQNAGPDKPFLSWAAPAAAAGSTFAFGAGGTTDQTILRGAGGTPYLFVPGGNAYLQSEPVRKVIGNLTTASHTFAVYVTIGYFEVLPSTTPVKNWPSNAGPVPPTFGAEVFDKIPGDMRQKYMGIVDMSNMALKAQPIPNDPDPHAQSQPFFTALTATARPVAGVATLLSFECYSGTAGGTLDVAADGQLVSIRGTVLGPPPTPGTQLVVGYGADAQVVTVDSVIGFNTTTKVGQVSVSGLTRTAWGGACVSNVRPGYAGPQPAFDINSPRFKPVVPYVERLR